MVSPVSPDTLWPINVVWCLRSAQRYYGQQVWCGVTGEPRDTMTNKRDVISRSAHKLYDQEVQCGVSGQPRDTVASKCSAMSVVSPEILWPANVVPCLRSAQRYCGQQVWCVCVSGQPASLTLAPCGQRNDWLMSRSLAAVYAGDGDGV